MTYYIGIDIGGTFTDCAVLDGGGRIAAIAKAPSVRGGQDVGVMAAIDAAAARLGMDTRMLLGETRLLVHGCTVATNAIVERKGAATALVATKGHEQALLIGKASQKVAGRTTQQMTHQSHLEKADPPLVGHADTFGITERVDRNGKVVVALSEAELDDLIVRLRERKVEAVAIALLWSFLNPAHEARVRERLAAALPGVYVCASHEIAPLLGEYERTATTVANAYVAPRLNTYIANLQLRLAQAGYRYPLLLAHCMGGLTTFEEVGACPLLTLDSGPVSGVLGARYFGAAYGEPNIICADMGGTTFDVALIERGRTILDDEPVVDRYTCLIPKVAVESIGAGGGSIVWIDDNGMLRVGPMSAGARPGPACYGHGGTEPAITDVDLVLGYIDDAGLLGGQMRLDRAKAEAAIDGVAARLGMTRMATAAGAYRIVNAHMADLMRRSSIDRGRDPREFVLFAYGGAAPLHIAYLAHDLRIARVYVPSFATVFSAMGMLTGGILHSAERSCTLQAPLSHDQTAQMAAGLAELQSQIAALFTREHVAEADRTWEHYVHVKYRLQQGALAVPVTWDLTEANGGLRLVAEFERMYSALYGANAGFAAAGIELVKLRVDGRGATVLPEIAPEPVVGGADPAPAAKPRRKVHFIEIGETIDTAIYDGARLTAGMSIPGPAVIDRMGDSIVLPSFVDALVDGFGNVVITLRPG